MKYFNDHKTEAQFMLKILLLVLILCLCKGNDIQSEFCEKDEFSEIDGSCATKKYFSKERYILYNVNPPEGFNLRRDVYIRVAVFLKHLIDKNKTFSWRLVLPPWGNLYHWRSRDVGSQTQLPWNIFFDIQSLQKYIPVIETYDFFKEYHSNSKEVELDCIYILQNDEDMFRTGKFESKNEVVECPEDTLRSLDTINQKRRMFWGCSNVTSHNVKCVIFHGMMSELEQNLNPHVYRSVMFDHMEIPLHDFYGSREYWKARRSMRYNSELYKIANEYRKQYLNSTDETDNTKRPVDWTNEKSRRNAIGGPYVSVHLRRRDFLVGRVNSVPTIDKAASQLKKILKEFKLDTLFVATDAEEFEFQQLQKHLSNYKVLKFEPTKEIRMKYKDGGVAIVDQIICSFARYFIGTRESTFTFRIQEDREIIGFPPQTTFNQLCRSEKDCIKNGGNWEIVW